MCIRDRKTLNGDILMGEDTQNDKVKEINTGEEIALTGKLDVTPIKSLMGLVNPSNVKDSTQTISVLELAKLTGVNSVFTAELTLPEGMLFSRKLTKDDVKFANAQDIFSVKEDPVIEGNIIKIKMVFDDPVMKAKEDYTIGDLLKALNKVGDTLQITVPGIKFGSKPVEAKDYTIVGKLSGDFSTDRISSAHYDHRMNTVADDLAKNPEKAMEYAKKYAPEKYEGFEKCIKRYEEVIKEVRTLSGELKHDVVTPKDEKNFNFPTDPFEMYRDRYYNKIYQHDGSSDVDYNKNMAYSLYGELNLKSNEYFKEWQNLGGYNSEDKQAPENKARIAELNALLDRMRSYGDTESGRIYEVSKKEFNVRTDFREYLQLSLIHISEPTRPY